MSSVPTTATNQTPHPDTTTTQDSSGRDSPGWEAIEQDDAPSSTALKLQVIVLVSLQSLDREVTRHQLNVLSILDANKVTYEILDGSDPQNRDKRNRLFGISGLRAVYPQFFLIRPSPQDGGWSKTSFWGDYDKFETTNEIPGQIAREFGGVAPPVVVTTSSPLVKEEADMSSTKLETKSRAAATSLDVEVEKLQENRSEGGRNSQEEDDKPHYWRNLLVLLLYTSIIFSLAFLLSFPNAEDRTKWLEEMGQKFGEMRLYSRIDDDDDGFEEIGWEPSNQSSSSRSNRSNTNNKIKTVWDNPLSDKDFLSTLFGTGKRNEKTAPETGYKDPFDLVDGSFQDQQLQSFFRNVASFFQNSKKKNETTMAKSEGDRLENAMTKFLARNSELTTSQRTLKHMIEVLANSSAEVLRQVNQTFGHMGFERFNLLQFRYYLDREEETKNSVWKRMQHRYQPELPVEAAMQLHDGLYLSQLAYAPTCEEIFDRIQTFRGGLFTLRNCTTEASVHQPAHFVLVRKLSANPISPIRRSFRNALDLSWLAGPSEIFESTQQQLEVAIVIRGSKDVFDFLTDGMLVASDYQDGKAHDGIVKAAQWLEEHYRSDLKRFHRKFKKKYGTPKPMKLWLLGHSLGGGTAALGAMNFRSENYTKWLDAEALGFGTPSVVSPELSYRYKDYITTVINDADLVPRTSGLVIAKTWLKIVAFNWTDSALQDYDHLVGVIRSDPSLQRKFFGRKGQQWLDDSSANIRKWLETWFDRNVAPWLDDLPDENLLSSGNLLEAELIPPGDCVHLYRDGLSYQGSYINCSYFKELEVVRHFVDDHLIPPGYYKAILLFVREKLDNVSWHFQDDLMEISCSKL